MTASLIQALADGFSDGGVSFSANYPGFHSNELHDALGGGVTSINERTAYACAFGAALAGRRAVVSMKNVGLNDAADPFLNSMLTGINAGLVLVVFDDCDVEHSQNRMDVRHYFDFYGGLWFDPVSIQQAYIVARDAFMLSERFGVPVVIRITNILYKWKAESSRFGCIDSPAPRFVRNPVSWVVHPVNAAQQEVSLRKKREEIAQWVETQYEHEFEGNANTPPTLIFGKARDVEASHRIRLFTLPLPMRRLRALLKRHPRISVFEHGTPYVAEKLRQLSAEKKVEAGLMNNVRLRYKYHNRDDTETLMSVIRDVPDRIVVGDLGGFTMDPHRTIDVCLCYGAAVATGMGAACAETRHRIFVLTGDAAFLHSGKACLSEAVERGASMTVIIFDNGGSRGTGGQRIPSSLNELSEKIHVEDRVYRDCSREDFRNELDGAGRRQGVQVIRLKTDF